MINLVFAAPFLVVAATTLKNGVALSLAMLITLLPTVVLSLVLRQKLALPSWLCTPLCVMVSMLLVSLSYYVIRFISVEIIDALGVYLYLLAAGNVVSAVFTGKKISTIPAAVAWALRYAGGFAAAALPLSLVRELMAYGTVWGFPLLKNFRLEGMKMPFAGFILFGIFCAAYQWLHRLLEEYHQAQAEKKRRQGV